MPKLTHEVRSLGGAPFEFGPWDGKSTLVYDLQTGEQLDLGSGSIGSFSPDSSKMVWVSGEPYPDGAPAWLIDLATLEKTQIGLAGSASFIDDNGVFLGQSRSNMGDVYSLLSGSRSPWQPTPRPSVDPNETSAPPGYRLFAKRKGELAHYSLNDTNGTVLQFDAYLATPLGPDALLVWTAPEKTDPGNPNGTSNLVLIDIASRRTTYLATLSVRDWATANDRFVAWTAGFCNGPPYGGTSFIYDRSSGRVVQLDVGFVGHFTANGLLAALLWSSSAGSGVDTVIFDPQSLERRAIIRGVARISWSPDYRYASRGAVGGIDGPCI